MAPRKTRKSKQKSSETPLMRQYGQVKQKYPHTMLLFRIGDFYETFGEDAIKAAEILGIVLTKRRNGAASEIELAGFPHHALNTYLPRLVRAGQRVAICDQLEDPKQAKGIVKRGVTEIVTPGITLSDDLLEHSENNYLAAVFFSTPRQLGVAFVEVSTGDYFCTSGSAEKVEKLLFSLQPAEVLLARKDLALFKERFGEDYFTFRLEDWVFEPEYAQEQLLRHFQVRSLKGFGLESEPLGVQAAGALLHYLQENEHTQLQHLTKIYRFSDEEYVELDRFTVRNLELLQPIFPDGKSLFETLDQTTTAMGARMLRRWISFPLRKPALIQKRLEKTEALLQRPELRNQMRSLLNEVSDLERLLARLATRKMNPREAATLRNSLRQITPLFNVLTEQGGEAFSDVTNFGNTHQPALNLLEERLQEEPPTQLAKGGVIAKNVSENLDEVRALKSETNEVLEQMRQREVQRTGISSLKFGFNKVFGYYIEITNAHKGKAPADYIRKQTLTNAERYITEELKQFEEKILGAEEEILRLEQELYQQLLTDLEPHIEVLQALANLIAGLDVLLSFGRSAERYQYVRPELLEEPRLEIEAGRHPVIENLLPPETPFVPNDLQLNPEQEQILLVSGPNMAGKSALLRQTALITLMAQMGSFVPAKACRLGLVDKIFTRVGAADNVSAGESTFMVEMNEAARILNNATPQSLILLDEVGRGTSTFDGVSIAWALVEYLHNTTGAKTLFATHYHELARLGEQLPRAHNYHISVREVEGKVIFLRKLEPGHSAHSFGINVAQMAGLPPTVVARARELLQEFEQSSFKEKIETEGVQARQAPTDRSQMQLFAVEDATARQLRETLRGLDINRLTPVEALLRLQELQEIARGNPPE